MGLLSRLRARMAKTDEELLAEEIRAWARGVPGATPIGDARDRERTKVAGVVKRITVSPGEGGETLRILIFDGAGECEVVLMGRRNVPGLTLGTRVIVEGVVGEQHGTRRLVNPQLNFAS
jgi:RecG-like helicase